MARGLKKGVDPEADLRKAENEAQLKKQQEESVFSFRSDGGTTREPKPEKATEQPAG